MHCFHQKAQKLEQMNTRWSNVSMIKIYLPILLVILNNIRQNNNYLHTILCRGMASVLYKIKKIQFFSSTSKISQSREKCKKSQKLKINIF